MPKSNTELVLENLAGFDRLDYEFVAGGYAKDGVLHFMQEEPVRGRDAILALMKSRFEPITDTRIEIVSAIEAGSLVAVERIDHYRWKGHPVSCPVANVTELRDGEIRYWREYFDRGYARSQIQRQQEKA